MLKSGYPAKRLTPVVAFILLAALIWPASTFALGVAGFDIYRPNAKNPDSAFLFNLEPGQSLENRVVVKNTTSDTVQNLRVYIADGIATSNGGITLKGREEPKAGLAKWISIDSSEQIALAPAEERGITFKLRVPWSSESNEKIAGIVVERAQALKNQADKQFMINVLPRAAILITQRLPGPALERLKIVDFSQVWAKNRNKVFKLATKNTGNIHIRARGRIDIYNMFGSKSDTIRYDRMSTIFPGATGRIQSEWKNTPPIGYFTAKAVISYGKGKSDSRQISFLIFPWWVLAFLPVLWFIAREQRKRRAAKQLKKLEADQAAAAAAAMETLEETVEKIESEAQASKTSTATAVKARTRTTATRATTVKATTTRSAGTSRKQPKAATKKAPTKTAKTAKKPTVAATEKKATPKKAPAKKTKPAKD